MANQFIKLPVTGGGTATCDYVRDSYSSRFDEAVNVTTMADALDQIFDFTSIDCSVSLSLTPSATREKGNDLSSILLSTVNTLGQNPVGTLTALEFKRGAVVIDTILNPTGTSSFNETTAVTATTTFSAVLIDSELRTSTATSTITFLYPVLYLVGAVGLSTAAIYSGATKVLSATKGRTIAFSPSNQVVYYCIPASIGVLTSIKDINLFETISDWTLRSENITGLDSTAQAYKIYEFKNLTAAPMTYTFA